MAKKSKLPKKRLNLALQGGGAHGAFTWGVLDRLIEEEDIEIGAISGTSAGAMNGALFIDGFMENGREGAKQQLRNFWEAVSGASRLIGPALHSPFGQLQSVWQPDNAVYSWIDTLTRTFSPYELNPFNINPLRHILDELINFDNLARCQTVHLFTTATNVETGQPRVFNRDEISADVLLASSCLPFLFQAVEIEGVPFWDGGYMGNPSLWPLFYHTDCPDILLVQINPLQRSGTPRHAIDIINRLNEISFNSSLISEIRAIHFVKHLIGQGKLNTHDYQDVLMHMIDTPGNMHEMSASTKMNASWEFFEFLHNVGREQTDKWIRKNKKHIGEKATVDLVKTFLVKPHHASRHQKSVVDAPAKAGQSS